MRIFRTYDGLTASDQGASVAMGNFDGVHLGHQSVLDLARAEGSPWGVVTFEPHPRQLFAPDSPPFRLMTAEARAHRLESLGADVLYELTFDRALAGLTAEEFVTGVLVDGLGVRHVVVGADFRFGKGRGGNVDTLARMGRELGFGVTAAPLVTGGSVELSSTAIRVALFEGRPRDAAEMLGHWHRIEGEVIKGFQRGRDLGFPTANIALDGLHLPRFGVYAVLVDVLTGPQKGRYHGAASIGVRPTFDDGTAANLEVFVFDFSGDLYGQRLSVALVDFLRGEEKFDGLEPLIAQMNLDCAQARARLAEL